MKYLKIGNNYEIIGVNLNQTFHTYTLGKTIPHFFEVDEFLAMVIYTLKTQQFYFAAERGIGCAFQESRIGKRRSRVPKS